MISFKIISEKSIIVTIVNEFKKKDLKGVSIIVDALFESDYTKSLQFYVDNNLDNQHKLLLENYCERTPYDYQINKIS